MTKISIYIPTCNRAPFLRRAIDSVLKQTEQSFELLIVDDNSSDVTHDMLYNMSLNDSRIRWLLKPQGEPKGAPRSRNIAIEAARGEFITGLDDDDYFAPGRLRNFLLNWDDAYVGLYSNTINVTRRSQYVVRRPNKTSRRDLLASNVIGSQIFTRTERLRSVGGFDERCKMWQDLDLWLRLLAHSNSHMRNTGVSDYFADASHDESRISNASLDQVASTALQLANNHSLTPVQAELLNLQLYHYHPDCMPWSFARIGLAAPRTDVWMALAKLYIKKTYKTLTGRRLKR